MELFSHNVISPFDLEFVKLEEAKSKQVGILIEVRSSRLEEVPENSEKLMKSFKMLPAEESAKTFNRYVEKKINVRCVYKQTGNARGSLSLVKGEFYTNPCSSCDMTEELLTAMVGSGLYTGKDFRIFIQSPKLLYILLKSYPDDFLTSSDVISVFKMLIETSGAFCNPDDVPLCYKLLSMINVKRHKTLFPDYLKMLQKLRGIPEWLSGRMERNIAYRLYNEGHSYAQVSKLALKSVRLDKKLYQDLECMKKVFSDRIHTFSDYQDYANSETLLLVQSIKAVFPQEIIALILYHYFCGFFVITLLEKIVVSPTSMVLR